VVLGPYLREFDLGLRRVRFDHVVEQVFLFVRLNFQPDPLLVHRHPEPGRVVLEEVMVLLHRRKAPLHPPLLNPVHGVPE
jgi:hypothetical protein